MNRTTLDATTATERPTGSARGRAVAPSKDGGDRP